MRITSKGQVTIPQELRERAGLLPGTEVEFEIEGKAVVIRRARRPRFPGRGAEVVARLRSGPRPLMTTDELMALTRGEE